MKKRLAAVVVVAFVGAPLVFSALDEESHAAGVSVRVPEKYRTAVEQAGSICPEITPSLIAAQVETESAWNENAESPAGARGISQFMPATWNSVGKDGDGDGKADILNPTDSIVSQGYYMCNHVSHIQSRGLSGDVVDLALAAYNAGIGAVQTAGGIPPYSETQNYVQRIRALAKTYEQAASSEGMIEALEWAKGIAADDTHQYVWGGEGPNYDCSGLTQTTMRRLGIELPHLAHAQAQLGTTIKNLDEAKPGDLLFWGSPSYYWHVALYAGDGKMISADSEASGINFEPIWGQVTLIKRL